MTAVDPPPTIEAVLFDLDGTLVDSEPQIGAALAETLARHGIAFDATTIGRVVGPPMAVMIERVARVTPEIAGELFEEYLACYLERHAPRTQPLPGAVALLDALAAAQLPLALVTNKNEVSANTVLGYLGWTDRFASVVGADSTAHPKPDPEHALEAMRRLGARPSSTALVGDLDVDMACGSGADLAQVIGLALVSTPELLRTAGATHVCATLDEVRALLELPRAAQASR